MPDMLPLILEIIRNGSVDPGIGEIKAAVKERETGGQSLKPTSVAAAVRAVIKAHQPVLTPSVRKGLEVQISDFFIDATKDVALMGRRSCICHGLPAGTSLSPEGWATHFATELEKVL